MWSWVSSKTVVGVSGGFWYFSLRVKERDEEATERDMDAEEDLVEDLDIEATDAGLSEYVYWFGTSWNGACEGAKGAWVARGVLLLGIV